MQSSQQSYYELIIFNDEINSSIRQLQTYALPAVEKRLVTVDDFLNVDIIISSLVLAIKNGRKVLSQILHPPLFEGDGMGSKYDTLNLRNLTGSIVDEKIGRDELILIRPYKLAHILTEPQNTFLKFHLTVVKFSDLYSSLKFSQDRIRLNLKYR